MFLLKPIKIENTGVVVYGTIAKWHRGAEMSILRKVIFRAAPQAITRWSEVSWSERALYTNDTDQVSRYLVITKPEYISGSAGNAQLCCVCCNQSPLEITASNGSKLILRQYAIQHRFRSQSLRSLDALVAEGTERDDEDLRITTYDTEALTEIARFKDTDLTIHDAEVNVTHIFRLSKYQIDTMTAAQSVLGFVQNEAVV